MTNALSRMSKLTAAAFLAAGLSATAGVAQSPHAGTYELVDIAGNALPAVVETTDDCTEEVTSAQLVLEADWTFRLEVNERETCGTDVEEDVETEEGVFTMDGETILFDIDEDPDDDDSTEIELDQLLSATVDGDMLHVTVRDTDAMVMFRKI